MSLETPAVAEVPASSQRRLLPRHPLLAMAVAAIAFAVVAVSSRLLTQPLVAKVAWIHQAVTKLLLVALALGLAKWEQLSWRALGFRSAAAGIYGRCILAGLALGAASTAVVLLSGSTGLAGSVMKGFSFGAMVLWVWIVSSISEEIFVRGWFQSSLEHRALWPSATLFGAMHLGLLATSTDFRAVGVILVGTTSLGFLTAWARRKSASLYPAIAAHIAFNVGGVLGGVIFTVLHRILTGRLPEQMLH